MFKAGYFYVTGGGTYTIDELGFDPQAVVFFGGNQSAEDTFLSGGSYSVFCGMMWKTLAGGTDYHSISNGDPGVKWSRVPITCISGSGSGTDFTTSGGTLGSDQFTVTVSTAPGGTRLVHYLAMGEFDGCVGTTMPGGGGDFALGFRPQSTLLMTMYASGDAFEGQNTLANHFAMGVGNYPAGDGGELDTHAEVDAWNNNAGAYTFRAGSTGSNWVHFNFFEDAITPGPQPTVAGGFYTDIMDHMHPHPTYIDETARFDLDTDPARASAIMMTCDGDSHGILSPDVGDENVYTARAYLEDIEAVLFFGPCGYDHLSQTNSALAYGYGVLTEDYQGCVGFDRRIMSGDGPPGFFQSKQLCHATSLRDGVRASSGEIINGNQVCLTGEIASAGSDNAMIMQMFARDIDEPDMWLMEV